MPEGADGGKWNKEGNSWKSGHSLQRAISQSLRLNRSSRIDTARIFDPQQMIASTPLREDATLRTGVKHQHLLTSTTTIDSHIVRTSDVSLGNGLKPAPDIASRSFLKQGVS